MTTYTVISLIEENQNARVIVEYVTVSSEIPNRGILEDETHGPYKRTTIAVFEGRLKNLVGGGKENSNDTR